MGKKRVAKCLVIDTDIARAAGGGNVQVEPSKSCRVFLDTMLETTKHKVVLTKAIQAEWNKHQSLATLTWRSTMIAQKRVCLINAPADEKLRQEVEQYASSDNKRKVMLKDIHLVEAALQADRIIISMDETVRYCFHVITQRISLLKRIVWVNPCMEVETPIDWLKEGAELTKERLLGHPSKGTL